MFNYVGILPFLCFGKDKTFYDISQAYFHMLFNILQ